MTDAELRALVADAPLPELGPPPFLVTDRPLARSTVAVVTTAALHEPDQPAFVDRHDESFRVLVSEGEGLHLGHLSQNYDRSGFLADPAVVYPVRRLRELADRGVIAAVADRQVSFLGNAGGNLATMRLDTGPRVARMLRQAGADTVILTPVCPLCTRTVCVLAHVLELHGLRTVVLGLVEQHVRKLQPPRALVVDFPFGRPLGRPGDPAFQHRVLAAALQLLEAPAGPAIETFAERVDRQAVALPASCPLPAVANGTGPPAVAEALGLRPAFQRGLRLTEGRTGLRPGIGPDDVVGFLAELEQILAKGCLPETPHELARRALDIRCYYESAAVGISGVVSDDLTAWLFNQTLAGARLRRLDLLLRTRFGASDPSLAVVPRAHRTTDPNL